MFYNDFIWLNPGPTTFFLILGIYFFLKQKWLFSSITLAVSTGFKQTAVIIFPILVVIMWRTVGFTKKTIAFVALYASSLVIISSPYVFQIPQTYFWALQLPIFGSPPGAGPSNPTTFSYDLSQPTRLTTFLGLVKFANLQSFVLETYKYLDYVFVVCYALLIIQLFLTKRKLANSDYLLYMFTAILIFFTLFGRGVYKYYFAGLTPLALPMFSSRRGAIIFEAFSLVLLFIPREVTPWMALLLITIVPNLMTPREAPALATPGELRPLQ
jgi:predicted membrane-bound dolichyl-phosphate-mannose-protein mannosyltransferase